MRSLALPLAALAALLFCAPARDASAEGPPAKKERPARRAPRKPAKKPTRADTALPDDAPPPWLRTAVVRALPAPTRTSASGEASRERLVTWEDGEGDARVTIAARLTATATEEGSRATLTVTVGDRPTQTTTLDLEVTPSLALASFEAIDLDGDGHKDLRVARAQGAKWSLSRVLLWDKAARRFAASPLAERIGALPNLEVAGGQLVTTTLGPDAPSRTAYVVERGELSLVQACVMRVTTVGRGTLTVRERDHAGQLRTRRYEDVAVPPSFPQRCELSSR